MDFSKILPTILPAIEMAAPTIAGLLGGPLASMGVQALENVFGLAPGTAAANPQAIVAAVANMTPDTAIALAHIDADLKGKLIDAGVTFATVDAGDRASARSREMSVKDWTPRVLAIFVTVGFFGLLTMLCFVKLPDPSRDLINIMLGALGGGWLSIIAYYFGSSSSSKVKDDTISKLSK